MDSKPGGGVKIWAAGLTVGTARKPRLSASAAKTLKAGDGGGGIASKPVVVA
jgi:hypothetical protein